MPAGTLITVEEYLATAYSPDCDFIDGHIEGRNLGERDHSSLQMAIAAYLYAQRKKLGISVYPEQRIRVREKRYRVPDVCVLSSPTEEQVLTKPPFICIEIVSPQDRMIRIQERVKDYLDMGVPYVWVLDPETRTAYCATPTEGLREIKSGILVTENPAIEVPLAELFES